MARLIRYFLARSFWVYGAVGGFVTAVQVGVLFLLRNGYGVSDFYSVTVAYVMALVLHYFLNKHLTFLIQEKKVFNVMSLKYLSVVVLSYLIYNANLFALQRWAGVEFAYALVITLVVNFVVNYVLYEKLVFVRKA